MTMVKPSATKIQKSIWLYVSLFALWWLARLTVFDCCWWLALINYFAEYYFLPLPILAVIGIVQKQWRTLIPLLFPTFVFIGLFGDFFLPTASRVPLNSTTLTATSFNLLWSNKDYPAIAQAIRSATPDIVGFQELHPTHYNGIVAQLETDYPYHTPLPPDPNGGVGLFSRYPIESVETFPLPPRNLSLRAVVNMNGLRVQVFVVHLSPNNLFSSPLNQFVGLASERNASRLSETALLRDLISPITEPVILLCDCNLPDTSQAYETLSSFLTDSYRETGWGFGHTSLIPNTEISIQRIDYVWHNAAFVTLESHVGNLGGSDHLPIAAKLAVIAP